MRPTAHTPPIRARRLPAGLARLATVVASMAVLATLPACATPATGGQPPAGWPQVPAACAACGVVESVTPVAGAERPSGIGAAAGAIIGGAIGREIGGSDHRRLLGWLGAIGGGLLGHEIEKQQRAGNGQVDVTLRMTDGSRRVVRQPRAPTVGAWVRVDGERLLPLDAADAPVQNL